MKGSREVAGSGDVKGSRDVKGALCGIMVLAAQGYMTNQLGAWLWGV